MTPLWKTIDLLTSIAAFCLLLCALPAGASTGRHEIAFIDSGVRDAQVLADGIRPGVEVVRLDAGRDGVVQMAEVLAGRRELQAIHVISHGEPGKVLLGTGGLSIETLPGYEAEMQQISRSLRRGGELMFYGCNVARGAEGGRFVEALSRMTRSGVAASTTSTGAKAFGGDWELEFTVGGAKVDAAVLGGAIGRYDHLLASIGSTVTATFATYNSWASMSSLCTSLATSWSDTASGFNFQYNDGNSTPVYGCSDYGVSNTQSIILSGGSSQVETLTITNSSGSTFKFSSFYLNTTDPNVPANHWGHGTWTVEGFRGAVSTGTQTVNTGTDGNNTAGVIGTITLNTNSNFNNVDTIVISSTSNGFSGVVLDSFVFDPAVYAVTFDANGGSGSMTAQTASSATNLTANSFTRSGYTFAGWNTAANGSGTAYADQASYPFTADVTLYAQWTAITYTVTYNGNSNSGGSAPTDGSSPYASGSTVTVLGNTGSLTRTDYTFAGWNTAANGSGTSYTSGNTFSISGNTTLYAKWTGSVTYNGNGSTGGTVPTDAAGYLPGATVTAAANSGSLTKTGYTFAGWNTAANGSGTSYAPADTFAISGDITLFAKWTATVTYNGNGNTGGAVPPDSTAYLPGATVTVLGNTGSLAKTGYTFAGWNTAADGSGTDYAASGSATFSISGNTTLYAKWTGSVTYNGNGSTGGTVPTDAAGYLPGATVTATANSGSLTKTGYTFAGWNTLADGTGTTYTAGSGTFAMAGNITLYARWTASVTYNGNSNSGGSVPTDASAYLAGATVTVIGNTGSLVRTGYTFAGWNTAANGSGTSYAPADTFAISGDITLFAKWTATVTYNGNGNTGGAVPTDSTAYLPGATVTVLGNTGSLAKTGYTFAGWNTAADGSGTDYAASGSATFTISGNTTLYAKWFTGPTVTTQAASGISATSATGNGNITATGGANATTHGVIYYAYTITDKIIGDAGVTNVSENGDFATGAFTASLTSLSVNSQYNARAYATSPYGTGYGARVAFWTLANVPSTPTVNNPTATTLDVAVNVNSNPTGTEFVIQETSTGNYVQADGALGAGAVWQTAATWGTKTVTGLTTGTPYTFQVKARNGESTETLYGATASGTPVAKTDQTITFANPGAQVMGTTPAITATASSSLGVTFTSNTTGVCTIASGGALTPIAPGVCTIAADQAGDASYNAAPQVTRSFTVAAAANKVHLDHNSTITDYHTIQSAVDASVDGDTVSIDAGIFVEQVTVTKTITLQGAGKTATFIKAPAHASLVASSRNTIHNKKRLPILDLRTSTPGTGTITVRNLGIDGDLQGHTQAQDATNDNWLLGIGAFDSNALIDSVDIQRIAAPLEAGGTYEGMSRHFGILAEGSSALASAVTVTIQNSTIGAFQKIGIAAWGPKLNAVIANNHISGVGILGKSGQNGMQIGSSNPRNGTTATISGNTIDHLGAPDSLVAGGYVATGILPVTAGAVEAHHNTITLDTGASANSLTGIDVNFTSAAANLHDNTMNGMLVGIQVTSPLTAALHQIINNTLSTSGGEPVVFHYDPLYNGDTGGETIANFGPGYAIRVVGEDFSSGTLTAGDGSAVSANSVQAAITDSATTLYIDTTVANGSGTAPLTITLNGVYQLGNFVLDGEYIRAISAPTVTTGSASNITATSATLNGTVNDNGATTTVSFDLGATTAYGTNVAATTGGTVNAGAGSTAGAKTVTGLTCNATYHFRIKGVNSLGTTNGSDATFTTSACPTYNVTYNGNGATSGSPPTDSASYSGGAIVTVAVNSGNLVKTGYAFSGWNTAADGSGTNYAVGGTFAISANTTLYATWSAVPTYTVTYNGNGATSGSVPTDSTSYSSGAILTVAASGNLAKTGYTFSGWNTASNGSGTTYAAGSGTFAISANTTLYAKWSAIPTYNVTYNGNGATSGSPPTDSTSYSSGATVTVAANSGNLAKTGYSFSGWNRAADGSGTNYTVGNTFAISANTTLYATWSAIPTYTITYNGNGATSGSVPTDSATYSSGAIVTVATNSGNLAKTGYTFSGWNTAANGSGTNYAVGNAFAISANTTLYATWTANSTTYNVTYNGNGATSGSVPTDSTSYSSGATVTVAANSGNLAKTGYTFSGWNTSANGSGTNYAVGGSFAISANTTLYAKWSVSPLALTVSALSDGATTTETTQNISGMVTNPGNLKTLTVNGETVQVNPDGSFSYPVQLVAGANIVTVVATSKTGDTISDSRTITLDTTAPKLTVTYPPDNKVLVQNHVTVTGTIADLFNSGAPKAVAKTVAAATTGMTVNYTVNGSSPQAASLTDTTYTFTTNLAEGMNTILVSATNSAGKSVQAKRTASYLPSFSPDVIDPTFSLAITDPASDIRTVQDTYLLTGSLTDNTTPVTVTVDMAGQHYTPAVTDGVFHQQLTLSEAKVYQVSVTGIDGNKNSLTVQRNIIRTVPKAADDTATPFTIVDALISLQMTAGLVAPAPAQVLRLDVAPLLKGISVGDGKVDIEDAVVILRMAVGLM